MCGLACLGLCCPELPEADRWQREGLKALEQEMQRQVLPDGFFFESSTSYHRLAVELFLDPALLARGCDHDMSSAYWRRLEQMLAVIMYITRPDGCVPQIGDNDDGRYTADPHVVPFTATTHGRLVDVLGKECCARHHECVARTHHSGQYGSQKEPQQAGSDLRQKRLRHISVDMIRLDRCQIDAAL